MGIEIVSADVGKIDNIGFGNRAFVGQQRFPNAQLFKVLAERVNQVFGLLASRLINLGNGR